MMTQHIRSILRAIAAVRSATLEIKLDLLVRALERRYRPDQPRAPKGTPEGGQWIDASGASRRGVEREILVAQVITPGVMAHYSIARVRNAENAPQQQRIFPAALDAERNPGNGQ